MAENYKKCRRMEERTKVVRKIIWMCMFIVVMTSAIHGEAAVMQEMEYEETDMIQEGRVWEYFKYDYKYLDVAYADRYYDVCLLRYSFGDTETVGDKIYHRCMLNDAVTWRTKSMPLLGKPIPYDVRKETMERCEGLVRQEGSKIYMLLQPPTVNFTVDNYLQIEERDVNEGEEVLLFDFGVQLGEEVECYMCSIAAGAMITTGCVDDAQEIVDGVSGMHLRKVGLCNVYPPEELDGWKYWEDIVMTIKSEWVEGVGNVGPGEMLRFGGINNYMFDSMGASFSSPYNENGYASDDNIIDLYCGENCFFNNLYSSDGTVWYEGLGVSAPPVSSVNVGVADENKTEKIYDMFGRQVDHMNPGSIYIVNGRKSICK